MHRWRCNYIASLKIGELELLPLTPLERALKLFEWMHDDFILAGPAAIFACHYFAPGFPRKGLLKGLKSEHRERALAGAANAAWDITHLSEFVRHANNAHGSNTRYLFASLDEGLRRVARTLLTATVEDSAQGQFAETLAAWWPNNQARTLTDSLFDAFRRGRQRNRPNAIPEFIARGEACLKAWSPTTSSSDGHDKPLPGISERDQPNPASKLNEHFAPD